MRDELPEFISVSETALVFPSCTFPKLRLAGFELKVPADSTPVPVSGIAMVGVDPFDMIERLPL